MRSVHRVSLSWGRRVPGWAKTTLLAMVGLTLIAAGSALIWFDRLVDSVAAEEYTPAESALILEQIPDDVREELRRELSEAERQRLAEEFATVSGQAEAEAEALARAEDILDAIQVPSFSVPNAVSPPLPDSMFDSYLLIGADASGYLADVVLLLLFPTDGSRPMMVSIPRDLYVVNPCTESYNRMNAMLGGCRGFAGGTTLLSLAVQNFTGIEVDHFALLSFSGFQRVIDAVGGVPLCFENPTRDLQSELMVDAGCIQAGGATTLAWVRSRHTEELRNGSWVLVAGSDFARQRRQQELLFKLAGQLRSFGTFASFADIAESVASSVRLDSGLNFGDAALLAWRNRDLTADSVTRLSIPIENYRTPGGAAVLIPAQTFNDVLAAAYPPAAR